MGELGGIKKFVDGLAERIERDRFIEDDIHRRRLRAADFDQRPKAGEHDHGDIVSHLLDESRRLIAAHLRHHAIENDEIEIVALEFFQGLASARRRGNRMPIATQIGRDDFQDPRLVIDACKPWEWRERFPIAIGPDAETKRETRKKWGWILQQAVSDAMREEAAAPAE